MCLMYCVSLLVLVVVFGWLVGCSHSHGTRTHIPLMLSMAGLFAGSQKVSVPTYPRLGLVVRVCLCVVCCVLVFVLVLCLWSVSMCGVVVGVWLDVVCLSWSCVCLVCCVSLLVLVVVFGWLWLAAPTHMAHARTPHLCCRWLASWRDLRK